MLGFNKHENWLLKTLDVNNIVIIQPYCHSWGMGNPIDPSQLGFRGQLAYSKTWNFILSKTYFHQQTLRKISQYEKELAVALNHKIGVGSSLNYGRMGPVRLPGGAPYMPLSVMWGTLPPTPVLLLTMEIGLYNVFKAPGRVQYITGTQYQLFITKLKFWHFKR